MTTSPALDLGELELTDGSGNGVFAVPAGTVRES
jgi:hypothetical protein